MKTGFKFIFGCFCFVLDVIWLIMLPFATNTPTRIMLGIFILICSAVGYVCVKPGAQSIGKHGKELGEKIQEHHEEQVLIKEAKKAEKAEQERLKELEIQKAEAERIRKEQEFLASIDNRTMLPLDQCSALLQSDESALFEENAALSISSDKVIGSKSAGGGLRVRIAKGVSVGGGGSTTEKIYGTITKTYDGQLIITDKRVIFVATEKGFEIPYKKLTAIQKDGNSLFLQSNAKNYILNLNNTDLVLKIIWSYSR